MNLTAKQQERIDYFIEEEWLDDNEQISLRNLEKVLDSVESPIEIDYMIRDMPMMSDIEPYKILINHDKTDVATKLRCFWSVFPTIFLQFEKESDIPQDETYHWELVKFLQKSVLKYLGATASLSFNPSSDETGFDYINENKHVVDKMNSAGKKSFYKIPDDLYKPIMQ